MIDREEGGTTRKRKPNRDRNRDRSRGKPKGGKPRQVGAEPRGQKGHELGQTGDLWWVNSGNARYSQAYGNNNSMYEHGFHDGVDIAVPAGSPVAALTSGVVVFAGNSGADGNRVGIQMPNGKVYYYGHLSAINVKVGDRVRRGQTVASSGNSGRSTGPHVHFEMHRDGPGGAGDDPIKFLARWGGGTMDTKGTSPNTEIDGKGGKAREDKNGKAQATQISDEETDFGWAEAVFRANPELAALLKQAKREDWSPARMQAAIRETDWYRSHTDLWRNNWVLKRDNPEEFEAQRSDFRDQVDFTAAQLGVELSEAQRNKIAHDIQWLGLNEQETQAAIAQFLEIGDGQATGQAGDIQDRVMSMAHAYGIRVGDKFIERTARGILDGTMTEQDYQNHLVELAKSAFPALAAQIDAGFDVATLAGPYVQAMSNILEVSDADLDPFDPTIRKAMTHIGPDQQPALKPLWQFEQDLRKDERWGFTNNARDTLLGSTNNVLKMWGLT